MAPKPRERSAARGAGGQTRAAGLLATRATYDRKSQRIFLELTNGVLLGIPIQQLSEIAGASTTALAGVELLGAGGILHWEALDADYSVAALVRDAIGRHIATQELARIAGQSTSPSKAAAARVNGAKGGRPRAQPKARRTS
jgi:hypothetical protein